MQSYPYNRPWRPVGLRDVQAPTYSRHSTQLSWLITPLVQLILLRMDPEMVTIITSQHFAFYGQYKEKCGRLK
jgi:hypothetical protein